MPQGNNMGNLWEETVANETADLILHAGDVGYAQGDDDERQADAFMQAFEQVIANAPWMPIVGKCARTPRLFYYLPCSPRCMHLSWTSLSPAACTPPLLAPQPRVLSRHEPVSLPRLYLAEMGANSRQRS